MKTKKELREEYRQIKKPMGVFQIRNNINNRVMIDSSIDMVSKWNRHKMELKWGKHRNKSLQKDWNEHGEVNFVFEVLAEMEYNQEQHIRDSRELKTLQNLVVDELDIDHKSIYM
ncbi:GIY-YIG nuclease family protein [Arenibacter sp. ARW7G5Y1]|uniref:GIY-YIG nuclease family protein n=1 Tax=Arenibacter sp. ARW7G5Y1 TaxID=2135619 RepID=UPI000D753B00|nr:GIY-YIG nuclease family protein [Arenibacter sp. ARW7G5Y1]